LLKASPFYASEKFAMKKIKETYDSFFRNGRDKDFRRFAETARE